MSDNWMHFFPADPRRPKPDWPGLRRQLIAQGFILDPRAGGADVGTLYRLWREILGAAGLPHPQEARLHTLDDLAAALSKAGLPLGFLAPDGAALGVPQFVNALVGNGALPPGFRFEQEERCLPGPLFHATCDVPHARYDWDDTYIYFQDFGDRIVIEVGADLVAPPGIPGSARVVEEWKDFLERWIKDPDEQWVDPQTGRGYGLLDLDWENSLGAGKIFVTVFAPGYLNGERAAALIGELAGQPFQYSRVHL